MMSLLRFLSATPGRVVQGILGSLLIALALYWIDTIPGAVVGVIGLLLLAAAVFDFCILAPFVGFPLSGRDLRKELLKRHLRPP